MSPYTSKYRRNSLIAIVLVAMAMLASCSYSSSKMGYPVDFKYAYLSSIEYTGINDSLKPAIADSIEASILRAGLALSHLDSLKGDTFSDDYNYKKAFDILNNGMWTGGGLKDLINKKIEMPRPPFPV